MVDIFALALSHGLLALAAIRLLGRPELDDERGSGAAPKPRPVSRFTAGRTMKVRPAGEGASHDA